MFFIFHIFVTFMNFHLAVVITIKNNFYIFFGWFTVSSNNNIKTFVILFIFMYTLHFIYSFSIKNYEFYWFANKTFYRYQWGVCKKKMLAKHTRQCWKYVFLLVERLFNVTELEIWLLLKLSGITLPNGNQPFELGRSVPYSN